MQRSEIVSPRGAHGARRWEFVAHSRGIAAFLPVNIGMRGVGDRRRNGEAGQGVGNQPVFVY